MRTFRVIDLDREADELQRLLASMEWDRPVILSGATARSIPLAVIAASKGFVVGVLHEDPPASDVRAVSTRRGPSREHAFRDIWRIMARA